MNRFICMFDDDKECDNCMDCQVCDLNENIECTNCGKCIEPTKDYEVIEIDRIEI